MQALSVLPSKTDPFLNLESAPQFARRKAKKKLSFFRGFGSGFQFGKTSSDLGSGVCFRCPRVNLYVRLALAFEEQVISGRNDSNSTDEGDCEVLDEMNSVKTAKNNDLGGENDVILSKTKRVDTRAIASSLRAAKNADDVEMVLKDMGDLPLQVYSSMIRGFGKDNRVGSAIALVDWLKRKKNQPSEPGRVEGPNLFIYNSLLGAIKQAERFELVEKIMNDMALEGIEPNVVTYNTLMAIQLAQNQEIKSLELFETIQTKGLSPSPASYSTGLLAFRRIEDGFGALEFYIQFKNKFEAGEFENDKNTDWVHEGAKLEDFVVRICYQIMRKWLVNGPGLGSTQNVLRLLTSMDQAGLRTSRSDHERLIWACTRMDHYSVARELYNRIRQRDSQISLSVCNHVIWLLGKAKKWWAALEIYEDLLDKGPKPNNMSYELIVSHFNFLLTAARKKGIWRWGVRLLNKMQEKGLNPGSKEWNSVLIACAKAAEPLAAVQIFTEMIENGKKPTIISYGALLSALEKGKLYNETDMVFKHMVKMGVEPNGYTYTIMASVHAAQAKFNMVESIIREMRVCGFEPGVVTFNAVIAACGRNHMCGAAYEWFERMVVEGVEPNEVSYEMLVEALAKDGKPKVAFDVYLRAGLKGLRLSARAYDVVVEAARAGGASIDLSLLGGRPPLPKKKKNRAEVRTGLPDFDMSQSEECMDSLD